MFPNIETLHLYKEKDLDLTGFNLWRYAAERLSETDPNWKGIGTLTAHTKLLINALCADLRVDSEKIGIMGHSLGGKMSFYTGCLDDRIKVYHKENEGLSQTRNMGIELSTGEYLFFVDLYYYCVIVLLFLSCLNQCNYT